MFDAIASVLAWFFSLVHSYGMAIVLLTLLVMAITAPLTYKGTKSMIQMQRLQPQMKAIQTQYKDDREKMNQELLAFYRKNNINPLGGCLPLLIQAPVFIVLFRVLRGLTARATDVGIQSGLTAMNLQGGGSLQAADLSEKQNFNPAYLNEDSALRESLSNTNEMRSFGIDLSESASSALSESIGHAVPFLVMILVVLVTGLVQTWQIQGRMRSNASSTVNSQQQMIMKLMPFFLPVISFGLPAGLVVYFVVSNLWRIGQQAVITRRLYSGREEEPAQPLDLDAESADEGADDAPAAEDRTPQAGSRAGGRAKAGAGAGPGSRSTGRGSAQRGPKGGQPSGVAATDDQKDEGSKREGAGKAGAGRAGSAMGRNRHASGEGESAPGKRSGAGSSRSKTRRSAPATSPRRSGRVTPPKSSGSRSRKKKRN